MEQRSHHFTSQRPRPPLVHIGTETPTRQIPQDIAFLSGSAHLFSQKVTTNFPGLVPVVGSSVCTVHTTAFLDHPFTESRHLHIWRFASITSATGATTSVVLF